MAIPTSVNSQITDAVTQSNLQVLGMAPAMASSFIYQSMAHSAGIMFQNSVQAQQRASIAGQAATNLGVMQIYSVNSMAGATATAKVGRSNETSTLLTLLVALAALKQL
ncbi:RebB family R body protein [Kordiimonas marina]|uniref:RebB family R body protein n=1 Tax=Kordiimonas marina TaxID=2872312 RepID=UPI001FF6726E|nr:RebB family R body protein [Kordiimonas marina]MCJ9429354.1 RebB family R body protein [Kordiimonas marina]